MGPGQRKTRKGKVVPGKYKRRTFLKRGALKGCKRKRGVFNCPIRTKPGVCFPDWKLNTKYPFAVDRGQAASQALQQGLLGASEQWSTAEPLVPSQLGSYGAWGLAGLAGL